jgi:hypothetical protein
LRDLVNKINAIHFNSSDEIHTLGHLYESMLKEMRDASGSYGWVDVDLGAQSLKAGGNIVGSHIQDLGKGWRRVTLTMPFKSDVASLVLAFVSPDGKIGQYAGVGRSIAIAEPTLSSSSR